MSTSIEFEATIRHAGTARLGPVEVDASIYRDEDRYRREVSDVLSSAWILAGHGSAVAERGHFFLWDGFGQSVVVARDLDGTLRAFHNVCQHRGVQLVDGPGCRPDGRLECPWHGFTYDLAGRVTGVPRRASFAPQQLEDLRAPPVGVAETAGFVWINLSGGGGAALSDSLEEIHEEIRPYGMDLWRLIGARTWEVEVNWKVVVEAFSEDYHARLVHDASIPSGLDYERTQIFTFRHHSMMVTPLGRVDYGSLPPPVAHQAHAYCHYSAFPTTIFSCFPTHAQVMSMVPLGVHRTELRVWIVAGAEAPPGLSQERYDRMMTTGVDHFARIAGEDVAVLQRLIPTRHSLGYRTNRYGVLESRLSLFHRVLSEHLGEGS